MALPHGSTKDLRGLDRAEREGRRPYAGGASEERGADKEARRDLGGGCLLASGHYTKGFISLK